MHGHGPGRGRGRGCGCGCGRGRGGGGGGDVDDDIDLAVEKNEEQNIDGEEGAVKYDGIFCLICVWLHYLLR